MCGLIGKVATETKGAFQKSEPASRTMAGPIKAISFFQEFLLKNHLLCANYLGFNISGWIILIKSEISHYNGNGLAGQFWQMESALSF